MSTLKQFNAHYLGYSGSAHVHEKSAVNLEVASKFFCDVTRFSHRERMGPAHHTDTSRPLQTREGSDRGFEGAGYLERRS